jgi:hypothetical protein
MKKTSLLFALAAVLLVPAVARADDSAKDTKQTKTAPPAKSEVKAKPAKKVTGTYNPRVIHRNGYITDGSSPLYVLDSATIHNSGAADLRQTVSRTGFGSGGR